MNTRALSHLITLLVMVCFLLPLARAEGEPEPLAGYTDGSFFLRSAGNNFVLYPNGRMQIDGYFFPNRGDPPSGPPPGGPPPSSVIPDSPADQRPRHTIFLRR